ncbi:MAG: glycosyltransferase family 4 protein [Actinobacteria bacterium]|nr:glycosyltransferase family 4 protein [Actinomycetota bacterium]
MRIGVLLEQALAPVPGGTGRYSVQLAAALAATAAAGDQVTSWTAWHRDVIAARVPGVAGPRRLPVDRRALALAWARGVGPGPRGVDLVHAPTPLLPPRRGVPQVMTVHDAVPWTHPDTLTPRGARWHRQIIGRAVGEHAAIAVPTVAVATELFAALPELDRSAVHVLGGGTTNFPDRGPAVDLQTRRQLGVPDRYLLFVGTLEPRKGLDVLVAALARAETDLPLVVAGPPGWGGVDLDELGRANGLAADRIRALGRVTDDQLGSLLRGCLALVAPSRSEGFGLPVADAMALGIPVVCSDVPALAEITDGAALLVAVDDPVALAAALDLLADDARLRTELAARGLRRAPALSWTAVAERAWTLYRDLVESPDPEARGQ